MTKPLAKVNPFLMGIVIVLCLAGASLMLLIPPDSLKVDLVYQTF
jgi:hypothetical protein